MSSSYSSQFKQDAVKLAVESDPPVQAERSKNGRAFTLGITDVHYPHIKYLVENCPLESGLHFPAHNDPSKRMDYREDWDEALKLAGITDYRFHDNRHTCGSYLAMAGYSLTDIAESQNPGNGQEILSCSR